MDLESVELSGESLDYSPSDSDIFELDVQDLRDREDVQYPALLLSNVLFTDCLRVLRSVKRASYREVDVWVELPSNGGFEKIGTLQLDSDVLILLKHLGICVTMYYDAEQVEVLDLDDPAVIEKFL